MDFVTVGPLFPSFPPDIYLPMFMVSTQNRTHLQINSHGRMRTTGQGAPYHIGNNNGGEAPWNTDNKALKD